MRTIKIRFTETKGTYHIQRKTWFGWKDIGYSIDMGYGGFWERYSAKNKEDLLKDVLENYYRVDKRFVQIIEHSTVKIY